MFRLSRRSSSVALRRAIAFAESLESRRLLTTLSVTTTADEYDGNTSSYTALVSSPGGTGISLREAIVALNNTPGADNLLVPAGTYTLARVGADDFGVLGDLDVRDALTIQKVGAGACIIQAGTTATNGIDKIFSFNPLGTLPGFAVTVSGLTLRYGRNSQTFASGNGQGGAMDFDAGSTGTGSLSMSNVICDSNSTADGDGGAIALFDGGNVNLTNVTMSNNIVHYPGSIGAAGATGGGLFIGSYNGTNNVTLNSCTITGNSADYTIAGNRTGWGGGIYTFGGSSATLTLHNTVVSNNRAGADGGGVYSVGTFVADQASVFSDNFAFRMGGGLYHAGGSSTLGRVTFSGNSVGGLAGTGGGGAICALNGNLTVSNSRLVNNSAAVGASAVDRSTAGTAVINATNNWWGSNASPAGIAAAASFNPWLVMTFSSSLASAVANSGATSTLNAAITKNSAGATGFDVPFGTPVTFAGVKGTVSPASTTLTSGAASSTWTLTSGFAGTGTASATIDAQTLSSNIAISVPTPTGFDLRASSDSGVSDTDNITNATTLVFDVTGLLAGATVRLYLGSTIVGTNGFSNVSAFTLNEGNLPFSVDQILDGVVSPRSGTFVVLTDRTIATPGTPDLVPASDTGASDTDNVTRLTNLNFTVTGLESGSTLRLLRNGSIVGTSTTGLVTDASALANATSPYSAQATDVAGNVANSPASLNVLIDTLAPVLAAPATFLFETQQAVRFPFDSIFAANAGFATSSIATQPGGTVMSSTLSAVGNDVFLNAAGFPATPLPDGRYRATLAGVPDLAGNVSLSTTFDFHVLAGDANRDATVNFDDLLIVAQNYGQSGKTFSQGNFNYSADGLVNFDDLLIVAQKYNTTLPALVALPATKRKPRVDRVE